MKTLFAVFLVFLFFAGNLDALATSTVRLHVGESVDVYGVHVVSDANPRRMDNGDPTYDEELKPLRAALAARSAPAPSRTAVNPAKCSVEKWNHIGGTPSENDIRFMQLWALKIGGVLYPVGPNYTTTTSLIRDLRHVGVCTAQAAGD